MKFFIFTCLLAVAFAEHVTKSNVNEMEYTTSSTNQEYAAESTEKVKLTVEEKDYLKQLYLQYQQKMMNEFDQTKMAASPFTLESSEEFNEKIELTEEQKNFMKYLNIMNHYYQKFVYLQYLKTFPQYQTTMYPSTNNMMNAHQQFPFMV